MASSPLPSPRTGHALTRARDERGVAFPSPVVMLSVVAVAMASVAFIATRDTQPTERRIDTAAIASGPTVEESATPEPAPTPAQPKPVQRGKVYVEVYNNSGIRGLAATTAQKATGVGWAVVGEDNWYGSIPATTVYHPPRLARAAKQLALDLGIKRTAVAVEPMKMDRLTVILTADAG